MKISRQLLSSALLLAATLLWQPATTRAQQSSNYGITVVPAPGAVTVDGELKDWDWSGRIWIYPDKLRAAEYSTEVAAMWDAKNLYIAAHVKDPSPMQNATDPRGQPDWGWRSDALQLRFKTDWPVAVTTWYYTPEKRPVVSFGYGRDANKPGGGESFCLFNPTAPDPTDVGRGVKEAFKADEDGKGYVQELSIPWSMLYKQPPALAAGTVFKAGFEFFWGDASGKSSMPFLRFPDNIQPGKMVDRIRFFAEIDGWGDATLSATGHVATRQYPDETKTQGAVVVHYQLPTDGPLPKTYRVTLAVVDPKDPNWIVSTFAAGVVRTVTAENKGAFSEPWDGLDDNFMPVPAGSYGVKGIYMPAETWPIDGEAHTLIPKVAAVGSSWGQSPAEGARPSKIAGDPVGSPLMNVDVGPNGKGVVYYQYMENGLNSYLTDFTKPINYDQIITGYGSGSAAGGPVSCTDGETVWSFNTNGGEFIFHADGSPYGTQNAPGRHNVFLPEGEVVGLSAWRDPQAKKSVVFVAEGGKYATDEKGRKRASETERVDRILALDGDNADILAQWPVENPLGLAARNGHLYVLHATKTDSEVIAFALAENWKQQQFKPLFAVPAGVSPVDVQADSHGRIYLSDATANHVYQFDAQGKKLLTFGSADAQKEGHYDPLTLMSPRRLSCWTDAQGQDRLMIVEAAGPNRLSEWSGEGKLLRQWVVPQTKSNSSYAIDPRQPSLLYMLGQGGSLVRWKINYETGEWTPDGVWSHIGISFAGRPLELGHPRVAYYNNNRYLTFTGGHSGADVVYLLEGDDARASVVMVGEREKNKRTTYLWRDLNGDGQVQEEEFRPFVMDVPRGVGSGYFGNSWQGDLTLLCIASATTDVWRLTPTGVDAHKNPIFAPNGWTKLLTDDVFVARQDGTATPTHGGNEMATNFNSSWCGVTSSTDGSYYVSARSGPDFSANNGSQFKLSRYAPDGHSGFTQRWRVGRIALQGTARPGEVYSPIFISEPVNGLVGIIDNSRAGMVVYTTDGMYVDTLLPDGKVVSPDQRGAFYTPGEFFAGYSILNKDNGRIYLAMGKVMPFIYEIGNWTARDNPVKAIKTIDATVAIKESEIAAPPEIALTVRQPKGKAATAAVARTAQFLVAPAGGPALDGSLTGWESAPPIKYSSSATQSVEVRGLYDASDLYLHWHARLPHPFKPAALKPVDHLFTHDRLSDTLGLYLQCDPKAVAGKGQIGGRPGDVRLVFGVFADAGKTVPAVLGLYPRWSGAQGVPQTYATPTGRASFEHVGLLENARLSYAIDQDGKGFVLVAAIPVGDLPGSPKLSGWKTSGNFDANLGGTNKFWWANTDGSASRETFDEPTEARLYPGSWATIEFH